MLLPDAATTAKVNVSNAVIGTGRLMTNLILGSML
jgi:hypothetical protein